jgi:DNA-binding SARP family transcriptional activator/tetratricopeptide (TPR) repeat protein
MALEFRLLGEVDVRVDGRAVEVGHARQRCVLAALLVDANRVVSVDQLVDRVWPQRAPQRVRSAVYTYVTRLRRALAVAGDDVDITRRSGGYVLAVEPAVVDLHRFDRLVARARTTDDDAAALALVEEALGLWRGQALAGLDTPWFNAVRAAADKQRLAAELDRNDLALLLGRHTGLLGELATAATARPLDERLAGQLMLALYRSGRQNDALAHYRQVRERLADELGTDPSPPLQHLHQQILRADPTLAAPDGTGPTPAPTPGPPPPVPRQLPTPVRHFTGRADELKVLTGLLDETSTAGGTVVVSAIAGTAGIGKTALAVHWGHQTADRFPDGQLYVNLRGFDPTGQVMDPAEAVRRFLDALGVPPQRIPADLDAQAALYRSHLAGRRMLILLDNARDTAQARPLLPGTPACLVLVTSRNQLTGLVADGAHPVILDLLTDTEARDMLRRRLGAARVAAEPGAVDEIVACCSRLPLALAIVAARAASQPRLPLAALAAELRQARDRLDAMVGDDPRSDVRAVFSWSYRALSPAAARLFRLLGVHPGPDLSTAAAASLAALRPARVRPVLVELAQANLIVEYTVGRYTCHDLLRGYAAAQALALDPDSQRRAAIHRILDHYLHTAGTADRLLEPARDPIASSPSQPGVTPEHLADYEQALAWFTVERPVLLAAVDQAVAAGFDRHIWQLAWTLWVFFDRQGHWLDQITTGRAAVAATARLSDPGLQAHAHRNLANAYFRLGHFDEAEIQLRQALDLASLAGDQLGQAGTHYALGDLCEQRGRPTQALEHGRKALDLYRVIGHQIGQADALNAVGLFCSQLGDFQQALVFCQQALAMQWDLDNHDGQAATLDSLGYTHHQLGEHAQAVTCYRQSAALFRSVGNRYEEAATLTRLGDTQHAAGDPDAARNAWQKALVILTDLDHPEAPEVCGRLAALPG